LLFSVCDGWPLEVSGYLPYLAQELETEKSCSVAIAEFFITALLFVNTCHTLSVCDAPSSFIHTDKCQN